MLQQNPSELFQNKKKLVCNFCFKEWITITRQQKKKVHVSDFEYVANK